MCFSSIYFLSSDIPFSFDFLFPTGYFSSTQLLLSLLAPKSNDVNLVCFSVNGQWGIDSFIAIFGPWFENGREGFLHWKVSIISFSLVLIDFFIRSGNWREFHWFHHHKLYTFYKAFCKTKCFTSILLFFTEALWDNLVLKIGNWNCDG